MNNLETYDFTDFRFPYIETIVAWLTTTIYMWNCDPIDVDKYDTMSDAKAAEIWRIKKITQVDNWAWTITFTTNFPIDADWKIILWKTNIWNDRATLDYKPLS